MPASIEVIFIHFIKMLVIPFIAFAIVTGAANLGDSPASGKVGLSRLVFFILTSAAAVSLAIGLGNLFKLGVGILFISRHCAV